MQRANRTFAALSLAAALFLAPAFTQAASAKKEIENCLGILEQRLSGKSFLVGNAFSPSTLSVSSGTTITFTDQDSSATHNVHFTSVPSGASMPSPNPSPNLKQGDTYTVTLTTAGTYTFVCDYHNWMKGTITVTSG